MDPAETQEYLRRQGGNVLASARVQITLEVPAGSSWGSKSDLQQVFDQAGEEAVNRVVQALQGRCSIIGKPVVIAVMAQEKR